MKCMNNIFGHPCGYCIACRLNRQREKQVRLVHECENWKDKVFLTLTYADECLPAGNTLVKRDVQLFLIPLTAPLIISMTGRTTVIQYKVIFTPLDIFSFSFLSL